MAQTALEHDLMVAGDDFLDQLMSDRGKQQKTWFLRKEIVEFKT